MVDVFVSYSRPAAALAGEIAQFLRSQQLRFKGERERVPDVWLDNLIPGGEFFSGVTERALLSAQAVVVLWTVESVKSFWVWAEADRAVRAGTIVQVVDGVTCDGLPLPFNAFHAIPASDREGLLNAVQNRLSGDLERIPQEGVDRRWRDLEAFERTRARLPNDLKRLPSLLLRPESCASPFIDFAGNLAALVKWAKETAPLIAGKIVFGEGGIGKTRLIIELCCRLEADGWIARFVPAKVCTFADGDTITKLKRVIETVPSYRPLLLVIDHADSRAEQIKELSASLLSRQEAGGEKARIILLARSAGDWFLNELYGRNTSVKQVFALESGIGIDEAKPDTQQLDHKLTREERVQFFLHSLESFAQHLSQDPTRLSSRPATLEQVERIYADDVVSTPLSIQLEALLHLHRLNPGSQGNRPSNLLDAALHIEEGQWEQYLGLKGRKLESVERAIAQATLVDGIAGKDSALSLFSSDPENAGTPRMKIREQCEGISSLLGTAIAYIDALRPDLIGEHQVAKKADGGLVRSCLEWSKAQEEEPTRQEVLRSIVSILNRGTRPEHGDWVPNARIALIQLLKALDLIGSLEQLLTVASIEEEGELRVLLLKELGERSRASHKDGGHRSSYSVIQGPRREAQQLQKRWAFGSIFRRVSKPELSQPLGGNETLELLRTAAVSELVGEAKTARAFSVAETVMRPYEQRRTYSEEFLLAAIRAAQEFLAIFKEHPEYSEKSAGWLRDFITELQKILTASKSNRGTQS